MTQEKDTARSSKKPEGEETIEVEPKDLAPAGEEDATQADEVIEAIDQVLQENEGRKTDMDELIDEVDKVLEENAEEFVKNYVQRGGQ